MRGGKFLSVNDFSAQEHASSKSRQILNFRVMAVRDMKLRTCLSKNTYILLDVLLCSIAEYFYELCRILASP